jgi:hypothetical protein
MKILVESVQMIHIGPNTVLTPTSIQYALQLAASNKMYAKFYTDKYFIQVNFMKDNTINVSSNIMMMQFVSDFHRNEKLGWSFSRAKNFVYQWMQISRRQLR